jgi:hypothetical protein
VNLVFLNSFEKRLEEDRIATAQVSISEQGGEWSVEWMEMGSDGMPVRDTWFSGMSWKEMIQSFRNRIQNKRSEGYIALVEMCNESSILPGGKARTLQMMHYYSELNSRDDLFQELRVWRNEQASKESKSPFILASNRMLRMISAFLPQTIEELRQIPGFGEYKTGLYGEPLLRMTASYTRNTAFPLSWVAEHIDASGFEDWVRQQWDLRAKNEAERRETKLKLLEGIAEGFDLEGLQQRLNLPSRELMTRIEELDKEGYDMEPLIEPALRDLPQQKKDDAWLAFSEAGDRFLKPIVKRLYGEDQELAGAQLEKTYEWLRLLRLRFRRQGAEATKLTALTI